MEIAESSPDVIAPDTLQWGHAFSDVEMYYVTGIPAPTKMLQWGHAFSDVEIRL